MDIGAEPDDTKHVHIVTNNFALYERYITALRGEGHKTTRFETVGAFLDALDTTQPHLVVLDEHCNMALFAHLIAHLQINRPKIVFAIFSSNPASLRAQHHPNLARVQFVTSGISATDFVLVANRIIANQSRPPHLRRGLSDLTPREAEVLKFIVTGATNKEVAKILEISPRTVEVHRARGMLKLGADNIVQLIKRFS